MNRTPTSPPLASSWLLWPTLALVFVTPSQISYAVDPRTGPFVGLADALAAALCLLAALMALRGGRWRCLVGPPLAAWVLVLVSVLSLGQAVRLMPAFIQVFQFALYLLAAYTLFVNVLASRERLRWTILTLGAGTSVAVAWGLADYLTQTDRLEVKAGFANCNTYSAFLCMILPLLLAGALHTRRLGWRLWWLAVVAVGLATMLSGPLIWVTVLVLAGIGFSVRGVRRWGVLGGLALFVGLMPWVWPWNYHVAVVELGNPYETEAVKMPGGPDGAEMTVPVVKKRWIEWQPSLNMLAANFALGVGAGNYQVRIGEYYGEGVPNVRKSEPDTNNLYLVIAGSLGFLGLVALVGILTHFWRRAVSLWLVAEDSLGRVLATGLPAALVALMIGNLFTAMFVRGIGIVMVLLFAMTEIAARLTGPGEVGQVDAEGDE